ncbi:MAG: MoaD/ThiS family protein [SAR324 cluster bacterium]
MNRPLRAAVATFPVVVEAISYVNDMLGAAAGQKEFTEEARPGDTVRNVLQRFSSRFPKLKEALWDESSGELGPHIEIIFNDTILGVRDSIDTPVHANDRIILTGQYIGGA